MLRTMRAVTGTLSSTTNSVLIIVPVDDRNARIWMVNAAESGRIEQKL